ncbi:MAG TPA: hypothetical protein VFT21_10125, partial [Gemmatimonadaceae bacterium]|nr:hypothetical protein [Gemmatimonadaceae bacterium]
PTVGYKKISEILGSLVVAGTVLGIILLRKQFYFPALVGYVLYGVGKTVFFGLIGRRPRGDVPVISDLDEDLEPDTQIVVSDSAPDRQARRRRRRRSHPRDDRNRGAPPPNRPGENE